MNADDLQDQVDSLVKFEEAQLNSYSEKLKIMDMRLALLKERINVKSRKLSPVKNKFIVSGKIVDEKTGAGIPNLVVSAFDNDLTFERSTRTDENGYYNQRNC